jgi:hypothetical protein
MRVWGLWWCEGAGPRLNAPVDAVCACGEELLGSTDCSSFRCGNGYFQRLLEFCGENAHCDCESGE